MFTVAVTFLFLVPDNTAIELETKIKLKSMFNQREKRIRQTYATINFELFCKEKKRNRPVQLNFV